MGTVKVSICERVRFRTNRLPGCLELEGIDARFSSKVSGAYPILGEVQVREDVTPEEIAAAVERENSGGEETPAII